MPRESTTGTMRNRRKYPYSIAAGTDPIVRRLNQRPGDKGAEHVIVECQDEAYAGGVWSSSIGSPSGPSPSTLRAAAQCLAKIQQPHATHHTMEGLGVLPYAH